AVKRDCIIMEPLVEQPPREALPIILPPISSTKFVAYIYAIHIVVILVDYGWYRKLLLPLVTKCLPYCSLSLTICLTGSFSKPYYRRSIREYYRDKENHLVIFSSNIINKSMCGYTSLY